MATILRFPEPVDKSREPLVAVPLVPWIWRIEVGIVGRANHHLDALKASAELANSDADWLSVVKVRGAEIHIDGFVRVEMSTSQMLGLLELLDRRKAR